MACDQHQRIRESLHRETLISPRVRSTVYSSDRTEVIRAKPLLWLRWTLAVLPLLALMCAEAHAQIKFIQITDPHLYDNYKDKAEGEKADKEALDSLRSCIEKINELNKETNYRFVAVTGDLGVEKLVDNLVERREALQKAEINNRIKEEEIKRVEQQIRNNIREKASELAKLVNGAAVRKWLFIPGNNDLVKEEAESIVYYHQFIETLRQSLAEIGSEVIVIDLCPEDESTPDKADSKAIAYKEDNYTFIGFDNASFKNNNDGSRLSSDQVKNVNDVKALVDANGPYVYILSHIPEVDDPYLVSGAPDEGLLGTINTRINNLQEIGVPYLYSSWFVSSSVRKLWETVVKDNKVKGLFVGHLHDWKRDSYRHLRWMRRFGYTYESLSKLYICPPLSSKLQANRPEQARGFQTVAIDKSGMIADEQGQEGICIYWYKETQTKAEGETKNEKRVDFERECRDFVSLSLKQLSLAQLIEVENRFREAEASYIEASRHDDAYQTPINSLERLDRRNRMPDKLIWLSLVGSLCFGVVIGWITSRTLRRAQPGGLTDIATVIGAVGGAAITGLFRRETGDFGAYCIGLLIGFFLYLIIAIRAVPPQERDKIGDWLGSEPPPQDGSNNRSGSSSGSGGSGDDDDILPPS